MDYVPQAYYKYSQVDFHLVLNQKSFQNQLRTVNLGMLSADQNLTANVLASSSIFTQAANTEEHGDFSQVFLST